MGGNHWESYGGPESRNPSNNGKETGNYYIIEGGDLVNRLIMGIIGFTIGVIRIDHLYL